MIAYCTKASRTVSKALDVLASGAFAFVSVGLVSTSFSMKPVGSDLLIRVKASRVALHAGTQPQHNLKLRQRRSGEFQ